MYVRLVEMGPDYPGNGVLVRTMSYSAEEIPADNMYRQKKIARVVGTVKSELGPQAAGIFRGRLSHILDEELDYAAAAFVAHSKLSDEELGAREEIIHRVVTEILGPLDAGNRESKVGRQVKDLLMEASFLYPTSCLEATSRASCAVKLAVLKVETDSVSVQRELALRRPLLQVDGDNSNHQLLSDFLLDAINYMRRDELEDTGEAAAQILQDQESYQAHMEELLRMFGGFNQIPFMRARAPAVREMVNAPFDSYQERLEDHWAEANERHEKYYADQLKIVYRMIEKDLPTKAVASTQRQLLEKLHRTAEEDSLAIIRDVQSSVREETAEQSELREAEAQRAVAQLLVKIRDTPPRKTGKPQPGKKKKKKRRPPKTRRVQTPRTENLQAEVATPEDPVPGLKRYLDFAAYEFRGLKSRLPAEAEGAHEIRDDLEAMIERIHLFLGQQVQDLSAYENLAGEVDPFLQAVRSRVHALTKRVKQTEAFEKAVRAAMQKETVAYGKRRGGVLRRGLKGLSWNDIDSLYHARHIDSVAEIRHGRLTRFLMPNEALAFYVTTSSSSGYDFDISCHLWQRRPGSDAPPADADGFMNMDEWDDTYVPCFVLHVPK